LLSADPDALAGAIVVGQVSDPRDVVIDAVNLRGPTLSPASERMLRWPGSP